MEPRRGARQKLKPRRIVNYTSQDGLQSTLTKSQLPVAEKAIETAGLTLGSDKAREYCPEMICADFLAGARSEDL